MNSPIQFSPTHSISGPEHSGTDECSATNSSTASVDDEPTTVAPTLSQPCDGKEEVPQSVENQVIQSTSAVNESAETKQAESCDINFKNGLF